MASKELLNMNGYRLNLRWNEEKGEASDDNAGFDFQYPDGFDYHVGIIMNRVAIGDAYDPLYYRFTPSIGGIGTLSMTEALDYQRELADVIAFCMAADWMVQTTVSALRAH